MSSFRDLLGISGALDPRTANRDAAPAELGLGSDDSCSFPQG